MKKYIPIICLILIVALSSCDGRKKAYRTTEQDLLENNSSDSFLEVTEYFPKDYVEVVTDTILNTGFQIKIKTSTDMDDSVLDEVEEDSIRYKNYYRNYVGELNIYNKGVIVLNKVIDKSLFKDLTPDFIWDKALMGQITLDQEKTTKDEVFLDVFYCLVESQDCKDYKIIISTSGEMKIEDLNIPEL